MENSHELDVEDPPRQIEFARFELDYIVMSKRKVLRLVTEGYVRRWDDPCMPTIAALRRRGVTARAIRAFAGTSGVSRKKSRAELATFERYTRDDLNMRVPRVMCVVNPLRVVLANWPAGQVDELEASYYPHDVPKTGMRVVPFSGELYIERDDFMEDPPKKFYRLAPAREVRLRYGYLILCAEIVKDEAGNVVALRCTYGPATRGGDAPDRRKVPGTIHWVSAAHALDCGIRLYDRLFSMPDPDGAAPSDGSGGVEREEVESADFIQFRNPNSLVVLSNAKVEPSVGRDPVGTRYQFERTSYFVSDTEDSTPEPPVFNRTVTLRDSWTKIQGK